CFRAAIAVSDSRMKPYYAVAAFLLGAGICLPQTKAADPPASTVSACSAPEPVNTAHLPPELLAASTARFMKLCVLSQGPLVYDDNSRLIHSLTKPGKLLGPSPQSIVPAMFEHGIEGKLTFY